MPKHTAPVDAAKIRALRKQHHWTQQELADKAVVGLRTIQSLEKDGAEAMPRQTMQGVADAFGVPRSELMLGAEPALPQKKPGNAYHLVQLYRDVDPESVDETTDIPKMIDHLAKEAPEISYILAVRTRLGIVCEIELAERDVAPLLAAFSQGKLVPIAVKGVYFPPATADSLSPEVIEQTAHLFAEKPPVRLDGGMSAAGGIPMSGTIQFPPELVAWPQNDGGLMIVRYEDSQEP